jgi:hypothetical protein
MILLIVLVAAISFYEVPVMWKGKLYKELAVFIFMAVIGLFFGGFYVLTPHTFSFVSIVMNVLNIKY